MAKPQITTSYRWDEQSLIRRIDVREQSNGQAVAYLYANPDPALQQQRNDIRASIRHKGWGTLSDHRGGEFALRVTGLRNGEQLIQMLQQEGFVSAPNSQASAVEQNQEAPKTFWQGIRANSLKWSGVLATIGNAMSFAQGVHRGNEWGQIGQGLAFGIADLPLALAGERDDARQLTDFLHRLKNHYEKEGIEIPRTASIYVETSDAGKTFGERSKDFMHRYANQIKCSFEGVAAVSTIYAGKNQGNKWKRWAPFIWGPGFIASLLIQEKQIDPEKYAQAGFWGRSWMKIQANPLVIGGTLGWSNNIASVMGGLDERRRYKDPIKYPTLPNPKTGELKLPTNKYGWDFAIPSVMVGANGLYRVSKKTTGGDIKSGSIVSDAYTIAAQIINKQPEELREKAIESTAHFFGERTEISEPYNEAITRLREEIEIQRQNPWFEKRGLASYQPQPKPRHLLKHEQPEADATPSTTIGEREIAAARAPITTPEAARS